MAGNGYLPASQLATVQNPIQLSTPTANAWMAFRTFAASHGVALSIARPDGGYRSFATQVDMHRNPRAHNLNPRSKAGLAAAGHSNHGFGTCVDIVGNLAFAIANASRFGFSRPFGADDPNHFLHNGSTAITGNATSVLIPKHDQENDMSFRLLNRKGIWWGIVISPISILEINSATDTNEYYASYAIHGDGSAASPDAATNIDITEDQLRIEYAQLAKRIASFKAALGPMGAGGVTNVNTDPAALRAALAPDFAAIPAAVIAEQKKPGN